MASAITGALWLDSRCLLVLMQRPLVIEVSGRATNCIYSTSASTYMCYLAVLWESGEKTSIFKRNYQWKSFFFSSWSFYLPVLGFGGGEKTYKIEPPDPITPTWQWTLKLEDYHFAVHKQVKIQIITQAVWLKTCTSFGEKYYCRCIG